jgi:uncharacterized membrane protein YozB (DUF420 family)
MMINHQDVRRDKAMMLHMSNSNLMFVVIYLIKFKKIIKEVNILTYHPYELYVNFHQVE